MGKLSGSLNSKTPSTLIVAPFILSVVAFPVAPSPLIRRVPI
jgi:hypothetical protein